jgi:hypothetical protein
MTVRIWKTARHRGESSFFGRLPVWDTRCRELSRGTISPRAENGALQNPFSLHNGGSPRYPTVTVVTNPVGKPAVDAARHRSRALVLQQRRLSGKKEGAGRTGSSLELLVTRDRDDRRDHGRDDARNGRTPSGIPGGNHLESRAARRGADRDVEICRAAADRATDAHRYRGGPPQSHHEIRCERRTTSCRAAPWAPMLRAVGDPPAHEL